MNNIEQQLLSSPDVERLLTLGSGRVVSQQPVLTLTQRFEQQVERTPDAIAVVLADQQVSYGMLNAYANQLAHYLRRQGVGPEASVGVFLERSLDVLVALWGILKAGGMYVPLDTEAPDERLNWIISDVKPIVLLTSAHFAARFSSEMPVLDSWWEALADEPDDNLGTVISVEQLAYMIYTSGSTGRPKGVMMSHRGISNSLGWLQDTYHLQPQERVLQKTSLTFDPSMKEIFWSLLNGAHLVVAPPQAHKDSSAILALTAREAVSTQIFIPSLLQVALGEPGWEECRDLRLVMCGGEALRADLLERFFVLHRIQVVNLYGPTEAAVQCSFWNCSYEEADEDIDEDADGIIPIGHPINNTQLLVLDERGELAPQGSAGELYIGGANLARGYLGQAALTAERFMPHPWSLEPGARLYRTGDRVRLREDGALEFLGRLDEQIKIRGIRIEPGEVEAVLRTHPLVQDALVLLQKQGIGQSLIAYVISAEAGTAELAADLQAYARARLPDALVPTFIQRLDVWPLTRNGKIDRQALPQPSSQQPSTPGVGAPRTEEERVLAGIWEQVLDLSEISIYDNFFELGGYSLLAMQLMSLVEQQLQQSLTLADLIEAPTIEQMAQVLQRQREPHIQRMRTPIVSLKSGGTKQPFFCVHPVSGDLLSYLGLVKYLDQDQPVYGIQARGRDEDQQQVVSMSIEQMATAYVNALLEIQPVGPYALGGHSFGGLVAFEMAQQLQAQGREVNALILIDSHWGRKAHSEGYERTDVQWIMGLATILASYRGKAAPLSSDEISHLSPEAQLIALRDHLVASEIIPQEMKLAGLRELLQIIKANIRSQLSYQPKMYQGKITLIQGAQAEFGDLVTKWTPFSSEPLTVYTVPGDHFLMLTEPHVQTLASQLQRFLDQMRAQGEVL